MNPSQLALTLGDPAGVGPEIVFKAWRALKDSGPGFLVVGDAQALALAPGADVSLVRPVTSPEAAASAFEQAIPVIDLPLKAPVLAGHPSPAAGPAIIQWIETAVGLALAGAVGGVVTAPIAKAALYAAGFKFPGHTELLGELTARASYEGTRGPVMMLAAGGFALRTGHRSRTVGAGRPAAFGPENCRRRRGDLPVLAHRFRR